jgi:DNA-binding NarL/FixJ family response regulator
MPKDDSDYLAREWARHVPETVHRSYVALLESADLSTTLTSIQVPVLVYQTRSSAASKVAALVPGSVLVERDYGGFGQRARADWDEHIGSRFGETREPAALAENGVLTAQEHKVLALIAEGRTNAQVARALTIAESTVARHVHNVLGKLGLSNRVEAAAWWLERRP